MEINFPWHRLRKDQLKGPKECSSKSTTVLFFLPCLANGGSCLQYLSPSMYSPVNAIESLVFSASPFIDTYCANQM